MNISNLSDLSGMMVGEDISTAYLLWVVLFSSIGLGFCIYGKKQKNVPILIIGILLMLYPMFISNTYILVLIGLMLVLIPYFL